MIRPSKQKSQEAMLTEEHKIMREASNQARKDGKAEEAVRLADEFNARLTADLGAGNFGFLKITGR